MSLIEILEEIHLQLPTEGKDSAELITGAIVPFEWVTLWARADVGKPSRGHARDLMLAPSGKLMGDVREYEVDLSKHERRRLRRKLRAVYLQEPGEYQFYTEVKHEKENTWTNVSTIPLKVTVERK